MTDPTDPTARAWLRLRASAEAWAGRAIDSDVEVLELASLALAEICNHAVAPEPVPFDPTPESLQIFEAARGNDLDSLRAPCRRCGHGGHFKRQCYDDDCNCERYSPNYALQYRRLHGHAPDGDLARSLIASAIRNEHGPVFIDTGRAERDKYVRPDLGFTEAPAFCMGCKRNVLGIHHDDGTSWCDSCGEHL